ncbi:MAG TPA: hypothetical protein DCY41_03230 [Opitutae bacterium]|nr:hypothetical protein [Opitutae bacterium]
MKHTLPVLTLTALAAAASAQVAPAAKQSLSYNRVVASWVNQSTSELSGMSIFAQAKIGGGLYVAAQTVDLEDGFLDDTSAVLGFAYSLPNVLGVATDLNLEVGYKTLGAGFRSLIGGGLEVGLSYTHSTGDAGLVGPGVLVGSPYLGADTLTLSASYSLGFMVKGLSLNASYSSESNYNYRPGFDTTSVGVGYNF